MRQREEFRRLRVWMLSAVAALAAAMVGCGEQGSEDIGRERSSGQRPVDVVLVSLDTLRAGHLSGYGYDRQTSPRLDELGRRGVTFEKAIAHSSHTTPSHRSLFQSRLVSRLDSSATPLAESFQQAGYTTAAFTGGVKLTAENGFDRGFDYFEARLGGLKFSVPRVKRWIDARKEGERFFLFLHTYDIHLPYDPPEPFDSMFDDGYEGPVQGHNAKEYIYKHMGIGEWSEQVDSHELDASDVRRIVDLYDGGIRYTDQFVGDLIDHLVESGRWDNTVFVVLSDHGEEFLEHGRFLHGSALYQESIHVPLIVRLPGGAQDGRRVRSLVGLKDVAPTLLELAGIPRAESMAGVSLLPLIFGAPDTVPVRSVLSEIAGETSVIRFPWKLMEPTVGDGGARLFDLDRDSAEETSVAALHPEVVRDLRAVASRLLGDGPGVELEGPVPESDDPELRRQLEALGYVSGGN